MQRQFSILIIFLLSLVVFSPTFAQNVNTSDALNSTKQQLITLLTKLLVQLEAELQTLLSKQTTVTTNNQNPKQVQVTTNDPLSNVMAGVLSPRLAFYYSNQSDLASASSINASQVQPVLITSLPTSVSANTTVTITGSNFDPLNNTINSTLGQIKNIPSLNGKIQFKISDLPQAKDFSSRGFPDGMVVTYGVQTSKGISANYGFFTLSSSVAKQEQNVFEKIISALDNLIKPLPAFAFGRMFDGGPKDTQGIDTECSCSGSTLLKYNSVLDNMTHYYVDMPGLTTLVGPAGGVGNMSSGNDYLTTVYPFGVCLVVNGDSCESSNNTPEGTLNIAGADLLTGGGV